MRLAREERRTKRQLCSMLPSSVFQTPLYTSAATNAETFVAQLGKNLWLDPPKMHSYLGKGYVEMQNVRVKLEPGPQLLLSHATMMAQPISPPHGGVLQPVALKEEKPVK